MENKNAKKDELPKNIDGMTLEEAYGEAKAVEYIINDDALLKDILLSIRTMLRLGSLPRDERSVVALLTAAEVMSKIADDSLAQRLERERLRFNYLVEKLMENGEKEETLKKRIENHG